MQRRVPDVSKLEKVIGFRPRTSLDQIIDDVIAEQRATMGLAAVPSADIEDAA
jgi:UDP-glucose 4-epimerase